MNFGPFSRLAAASMAVAAAGLVSPSVGSATIHGTYAPLRAAARPDAANLNQVVSEGSTLAALLYGNLMDVYGTPIVVSTNPRVYRDGPLPTLPEINVPASPLSIYQFDYASNGTGAGQLDFVAQQSGFKAATASMFPATNDGEENYSNSAPFGFLPWVGTTGERLNPRTSSDSIHFGTGDAPIPVGPVNAGFGSGTYADSLASYNGSIASPGSPEGYNVARGPAQVVPVFGTAISIVFNTIGLTVPPGGLKLTQNDVCGIMTGQLTNWSQTSANPGNVPIHIDHRSDGSGTTFLFVYDMSEICSKNNPNYLTFGITNLWNQPGFTASVGTDSENYTPSGQIPPDTSAPATVWPSTSIAEKGNPGVLDCVNGIDDSGTGQACGQGVVAYLSPSYVSQLTQGAEALVQNLAGNFERATTTTTEAALSGASVLETGPPGYPVAPKLYFPFPKASNGAPISGYTYAYFYTCSDTALKEQVKAIQGLFNFAFSTRGDRIVSYWELAPMKRTLKRSTVSAIDGLFAGNGPHIGRYIDPLNGKLLPYTCSPV